MLHKCIQRLQKKATYKILWFQEDMASRVEMYLPQVWNFSAPSLKVKSAEFWDQSSVGNGEGGWMIRLGQKLMFGLHNIFEKTTI